MKKEAKSLVPSSELVVIWTTVSDESAGRRLAEGLLENRLAACVQIDAAMTSFYHWQGTRHADVEHRVVIKTLASKSDATMKWLVENHPYDTAQIIVLPVLDTHPPYQQWVRDQVSQDDPDR